MIRFIQCIFLCWLPTHRWGYLCPCCIGLCNIRFFCHCFLQWRIQSTWLQWPLAINAFKNIKPLISPSHAWEQSQCLSHASTFITLLEISTHIHNRAQSEHSSVITNATITGLRFKVAATQTPWGFQMTFHM